MDLSIIGSFLAGKWPIVTSIVAILWIVEKLLETVGTMTKSKLVDNIGVYLGDALLALFPKSAPVAAPAVAPAA